MSDLPARILAEIDKREDRLRCIGGATTRLLRTGAQHAALIARAFENLPTDTVVDDDDVDSILTWVLPDADRQAVDVEAELRRCAADRRIVERHEPRDAGVRTKWVICDYCSHVPDAVEWPCPDIVDLAAGYDITVDGEA